VANYIDLDLATAPVPESGPCLYKGVMVACGPPGLIGGKNILYHNNGNGTFSDVSESAGITQANGTFGLVVLTADFDNDGWLDIYVANDSTPSALYQNKKNGKFVDVGMEAGCVLSKAEATQEFQKAAELDPRLRSPLRNLHGCILRKENRRLPATRLVILRKSVLFPIS